MCSIQPINLKSLIQLNNNVERLTISLDDESYEAIEEYSIKHNCSKSSAVKKAIKNLTEISEIEQRCDKEKLKTYSEFLINRDHIILDIDHWSAFFKEIDNGSEQFWEELFEIGIQHQKEYYSRGLINTKDILNFIEKTNWYNLNEDSENSYTLILNIAESAKFIETRSRIGVANEDIGYSSYNDPVTDSVIHYWV